MTDPQILARADSDLLRFIIVLHFEVEQVDQISMLAARLVVPGESQDVVDFGVGREGWFTVSLCMDDSCIRFAFLPQHYGGDELQGITQPQQSEPLPAARPLRAAMRSDFLCTKSRTLDPLESARLGTRCRWPEVSRNPRGPHVRSKSKRRGDQSQRGARADK